ncbi:hypothetical protein Mapa_012343 [Marchantia paleacea]|nr:hypothetical protein Mapa_012343 [Marchantia paleacea]
MSKSSTSASPTIATHGHLIQIRDASSSSNSSFSSMSDVPEMRRVFQKLDENNDGMICTQDLFQFMTRLGFNLSEEEAVAMLQSVDTNRDGRVDFDEFLSLHMSNCDEEATSFSSDSLPGSTLDEDEEEEDTLLEAFRVFDKNEDGIITAHELQTVLLDLGFPEGRSLKSCEKMIQNVDIDGNGAVDIKEFKLLMRSKCLF